MTLAELEHREKVALLALLGLMARLDNQVERDEVELLRRVVSELGDDFESVAREAAELPDNDAILGVAQEVTRQDAREVIYELLYDMALREVIVDRERELLTTLARTWALPPPVDGRDSLEE